MYTDYLSHVPIYNHKHAPHLALLTSFTHSISHLSPLLLVQCINCGACANFAPNNFKLAGGHHIVYKQPSTDNDIDASKAALSACPVAAIRLDISQKDGDGMLHRPDKSKEQVPDKPFPRLLTDNVWFVGHHNKASFGAVPYLARVVSKDNDPVWIMIDTPKFSKSSVETVTSLTGPDGPDYLLLTHVDDTADHNKWKDRFPTLQRIFHSGDLGAHNWIGDETLGDVEILLTNESDGDSPLQLFDLSGTPLDDINAILDDNDNTLRETKPFILHTPGHSPGSISLYLPDHQTLFTGDTLGYTQRTGTLTGFPRYGNNLKVQATTLQQLSLLDWTVVAPGHGHARVYQEEKDGEGNKDSDAEQPLDRTVRNKELQEAIAELNRW